jgi:hydrogen peroxide-dependent heme synthase
VSRPHMPPADLPEPSVRLTEGWHCLHLYYKIDPAAWASLSASERQQGREQVTAILDPARDGAPIRLQTSVVSGHKADLAMMIMDPDPLKIDGVKQALRASALGSVLVPAYSFVSITEISEYVPTVEQYSARLQMEGSSPEDPAYAAKVKAYEQRLPMMNKQRLEPDFPAWPATCFYPMNKARHPLANWFTEPFSERSSLMAEHATSGIKFAGKVSQLITASTGLDDWEWGVTLWGRTPQFLKDIVYTMRFDRASAKYAEFGPFYVSYILPPQEAFDHLLLK